MSKKSIQVGRASFRKAERPEPTEKAKKVGQARVISWGADNLYPHDMVGWREDNPIHGGIVSQKVTFMSSAGFDVSGLSGHEDEVSFLLPDAVDDFETFNGFAILYTRIGERWKPEHIDFESVRYLEEEGMFAISDDWSSPTQSEEKTNYREIRDIKFAQLNGEEADTEVLHYSKVKPKQRKYKNGRLSLCYYPVPNYSGAIIPILAGIEQDYFTYSEAVNGYKGGTIVSLNNGQPETEEEADEIADKVKADSTDRDTQGGVVVLFADGTENAATVMSLSGNDLDKRYIESNKEIRNKIMIGHAVGSPSLFAVNNETMFGGKEEMEVSYILLSNNYIKLRQTFISSAMVWAFARLGIKDVSISFKKYDLNLAPTSEETYVRMEQDKQVDPVSLALKLCGRPRSAVKVLKTDTFDFETSDEDFLRKHKFNTLTQEQSLIVALIKQGKNFNEVSKEIGKGPLYLSLELIKLNAKGVLSGWKVKDDTEAPKTQVLYSYEVKAGMGSTLISGSRQFCRDLVGLDRMYTREEIDTISSEVGRDVWRYRGGWYTNPSTGKTTPSCRHEWKQNVVSV